MSVLAVNPADVAKWAELRGQLASAAPAKQAELLSNQARLARRQIIQMIDEAGQGHIGGDFSVIDVMTTLFSAVLNIDPADPTKDDRDRFILSKGHCSAALYTTLAFNGFFDRAELATFMQPYSALNGHPNRNKVPGVETNTGPLGHGLPVGVGTCLLYTSPSPRDCS